MLESRHPARSEQRRLVVVALVAAVSGGVVAWTAVFLGVGVWGFPIGAAVTAVIAGYGRHRQPALGFVAAFTFAFMCLSWPLLWVAVGFVRYWLTGESLGE
jgi:apolipoprotein N-acyltransferase